MIASRLESIDHRLVPPFPIDQPITAVIAEQRNPVLRLELVGVAVASQIARDLLAPLDGVHDPQNSLVFSKSLAYGPLCLFPAVHAPYSVPRILRCLPQSRFAARRGKVQPIHILESQLLQLLSAAFEDRGRHTEYG